MFVESAINGGHHFRENLGMGPESRVDGFVDDGPEFFFHRGVSGVGGNEDDSMVCGESGGALDFAGVPLTKTAVGS